MVAMTLCTREGRGVKKTAFKMAVRSGAEVGAEAWDHSGV